MNRGRARRWAAGLAVFGLLERAGLWLAYAPVEFSDTAPYMRLAAAIQQSGLQHYDGTRVPGYPAFLAMLDQNPHTIWLAQMALGWGISMLLFAIGWKSTGSARLGFVTGMAYNLIPGVLLFEANLLSETLATFFVILSVTLLMMVFPRAGDRANMRFSLLALLGLSTALAGMVRLLFLVLPVWLTAYFWVEGAGGNRWRSLASFAIAPTLILGGWVLWVYSTYGMLAPTTMGGYHLVNHAGEFFEDLPDEHAAIRDTYLEYRGARLAERGVTANTIWDAIDELQEVSGLSFFGLSEELQRLSLRLIAEHPGRYLANVIEGWIDFWKAPVYWEPASFRLAGLVPVINGWAVVGRGISIAANVAFLLGSVAAVLSAPARRMLKVDRLVVAAAGMVWVSSIVQTLVDHGDNERWLIPLQMVVIVLVLRGIYFWLAGRQTLLDPA